MYKFIVQMRVWVSGRITKKHFSRTFFKFYLNSRGLVVAVSEYYSNEFMESGEVCNRLTEAVIGAGENPIIVIISTRLVSWFYLQFLFFLYKRYKVKWYKFRNVFAVVIRQCLGVRVSVPSSRGLVKRPRLTNKISKVDVSERTMLRLCVVLLVAMATLVSCAPARMRVCGAELADVLALVCKDRGYNGHAWQGLQFTYYLQFYFKNYSKL